MFKVPSVAYMVLCVSSDFSIVIGYNAPSWKHVTHPSM